MASRTLLVSLVFVLLAPSLNACQWVGNGFSDFASGHAVDINEAGQVVGNVTFGDDSTRAFLWEEEDGFTDLGTLDGPGHYVHTYAEAINDQGKIAGFTNELDNGKDRAVLWEDGEVIDLGTLGGDRARAQGINNRGQVVGWSYLPGVGSRAFLWENGTMTDLGALGPDAVSEAVAINDAGQVVGWSFGPDRYDAHAVLWQDGQIIDLGTLNPRSGQESEHMRDGSRATAINASGQIVGTAATGEGETVFGDSLPFLWADGQMTALEPLGDASSEPWDINDAGIMVGGGQVPTTNEDAELDMRAVLWKDGAIVDLTTQGWNGCCALALNEKGQIVGVGETERGEYRPVLWQDGVMRELTEP